MIIAEMKEDILKIEMIIPEDIKINNFLEDIAKDPDLVLNQEIEIDKEEIHLLHNAKIEIFKIEEMMVIEEIINMIIEEMMIDKRINMIIDEMMEEVKIIEIIEIIEIIITEVVVIKIIILEEINLDRIPEIEIDSNLIKKIISNFLILLIFFQNRSRSTSKKRVRP